MRPLLHPSAADELEAAFDHYQGLSAGLGFEFIDEVERIASLLCHTPNICSRLPSAIDAFHFEDFLLE